MPSEEFRALLKEMVKAAGQEIIDRADYFVGCGDLMSDFEIKIIFPMASVEKMSNGCILTDGRILSGVPMIEVRSSYISKNSYDVMCDYHDKN